MHLVEKEESGESLLQKVCCYAKDYLDLSSKQDNKMWRTKCVRKVYWPIIQKYRLEMLKDDMQQLRKHFAAQFNQFGNVNIYGN